MMVVGMNYAHPKGEWKETDVPRMNSLQSLYPDTKVFGISQQRYEDNETYVWIDVRSDRSWKVGGALCNRRPVIGIIDYFWLPTEYFRGGEYNNLGYGNRWFCNHIINFFGWGGKVFFVPNDSGGCVDRMVSEARKNNAPLSIEYLSRDNALENHPLVVATTNVENTKKWKDTFGTLTQLTFFDRYLNKDYPFVVAHCLNSMEEALDYVNARKDIGSRGRKQNSHLYTTSYVCCRRRIKRGKEKGTQKDR